MTYTRVSEFQSTNSPFRQQAGEPHVLEAEELSPFLPETCVVSWKSDLGASQKNTVEFLLGIWTLCVARLLQCTEFCSHVHGMAKGLHDRIFDHRFEGYLYYVTRVHKFRTR
jgi:hypothetical protein